GRSPPGVSAVRRSVIGDPVPRVGVACATPACVHRRRRRARAAPAGCTGFRTGMYGVLIEDARGPARRGEEDASVGFTTSTGTVIGMWVEARRDRTGDDVSDDAVLNSTARRRAAGIDTE